MTNNAINSNIPIEVSKGGTGVATLTQYSPLIGHATSPIGTITPGTNGQVLIAKTGDDPAFVSLTSPNSTVSRTAGAGTLNLSVVNATGKVTSFAPVLSFGGGSTGITYSNQRCWYLRLGNFVFFSINISLTSKGSSTGAVAISLPLTAATGKFACSIFNLVNISFTGRLVSYVEGGSLFLMNSASGSAAAAVTDTNFNNNTQLWVSGCYLV